MESGWAARSLPGCEGRLPRGRWKPWLRQPVPVVSPERADTEAAQRARGNGHVPPGSPRVRGAAEMPLVLRGGNPGENQRALWEAFRRHLVKGMMPTP